MGQFIFPSGREQGLFLRNYAGMSMKTKGRYSTGRTESGMSLKISNLSFYGGNIIEK
jgi:hypothetical protein